MKKLPEYLDNIFLYLAEMEEKHGGMKKDKAYELFRQEALEESLTAKANPAKKKKKNPRLSSGYSPLDFDSKLLAEGTAVEMEHTDDQKEAQKIAMDHLVEDKQYYKKLARMEAGQCNIPGAEANPTKKGFLEIYDYGEALFNSSPIGNFLGKIPESKDGKFGNKGLELVPQDQHEAVKFFEEIRNYCLNTGNIAIAKILGRGYPGRKQRFFGSKKEKISRGFNKNISSYEYPSEEISSKKLIAESEAIKLKQIAKREKDELRTLELIETERYRFMRLMVASVCFAIQSSVFNMSEEKLFSLLDENIRNIFSKNFDELNVADLNRKGMRREFVYYVIKETLGKLKKGEDPFSAHGSPTEVGLK